jgi:hypothetical protein
MIPNYGKCNRKRSALIFENLQFDHENVDQGQSALCHQIRMATAYNSRYCYAYRIPYRFRDISRRKFWGGGGDCSSFVRHCRCIY